MCVCVCVGVGVGHQACPSRGRGVSEDPGYRGKDSNSGVQESWGG